MQRSAVSATPTSVSDVTEPSQNADKAGIRRHVIKMQSETDGLSINL